MIKDSITPRVETSKGESSFNISTVEMGGHLLRRGFWNDWQSRYVELRNFTLYYSLRKGGVWWGKLPLTAQCQCEDSTVRHFCFSITQGNGEVWHFAADSIADKLAWTETIQASLSLLRLLHRKTKVGTAERRQAHDLALNQYRARPKIYIKLIQARSLLGKDIGGFSDPYAKILVGSSTARTITRKRDLNPMWGMVFTFDWDTSMRFARIEVWDEDYTSADDFLGAVMIPLLPLLEGGSQLKWHNLCKRSPRSTVAGQIQVEVVCSGQPDPEHQLWQFFREIQALPELSLNLAASTDGWGLIALNNFCETPPNEGSEVPSGSGKDKEKGKSGTGEQETSAQDKQEKHKSVSDVADTLPPSDTSITEKEAEEEEKELVALDAAVVETSDPLPTEDAGQRSSSASPVPRSDRINSIESSASVADGKRSGLNGFPLYFPPLENEVLEDLSIRIHLIATVRGNKISSPGVLLLTNYRLIFVSNTRLYSARSASRAQNTASATATAAASGVLGLRTLETQLDAPEDSAANVDKAASRLGDKQSSVTDLTTQIAISSIMEVALGSDTESTTTAGGAVPFDAITIKTADSRTVTFLFKHDHDALTRPLPAQPHMASEDPEEAKETSERAGSPVAEPTLSGESHHHHSSRESDLRTSGSLSSKPTMALSAKGLFGGAYRQQQRKRSILNDVHDINLALTRKLVSEDFLSDLDARGTMDLDRGSTASVPRATMSVGSLSVRDTNLTMGGVDTAVEGVRGSLASVLPEEELDPSADVLISPMHVQHQRKLSILRQHTGASPLLRNRSSAQSTNTTTNSSTNLAGMDRQQSVSARPQASLHLSRLSPLELCWLKLLRDSNNNSSVEALESEEGPPSQRFFARLKFRAINRLNERDEVLLLHKHLLDTLQKAYGDPLHFPAAPEAPGTTPHRELSFAQSEQEFKGVNPNTSIISDSSAEVLTLSTLKPFDSQMINLVAAHSDDRSHEGRPGLGFGFTAQEKDGVLDGQDSLKVSFARTEEPAESLVPTAAAPTPGQKKREEHSLGHLVRRIQRSPALQNTFTKLLFNMESSWCVYSPSAELQRQEVSNKWRLTEVNKDFELCATYPALLVVPAVVSDEILWGSARFRSKSRIPVLSWFSKRNQCSICRASQPLVGLSNARCPEDELLVHEINSCGPSQTVSSTVRGARHVSLKQLSIDLPPGTALPGLFGNIESVETTKVQRPCVIVDARPVLNARANQAAGKGFESEKAYGNVTVFFCEIANIHVMRKSLEMLEESCADQIHWLRNLDSSGWLTHVHKVLVGAARIAHFVAYESLSVLVHCSDGWDRTAQLVSLSMLMLDGYYRTLEGFIVLIEKEWLSFGHKFADRLAWSFHGWSDEERSPIFLQFLDCVHQCLIQAPDAFQFNEQLLLFIASHLQSGWFANFMFNSEKDRRAFLEQNDCPALSLWAVVFGDSDRFLNPHFRPREAPVVPVVSKARIVLWHRWFLRWQDRLWAYAWISENKLAVSNKKAERGQVLGAWLEDKEANHCHKCHVRFHICQRRHHCRCCGLIFCNDCTKQKRIIAAISEYKAVRCCEDCAILLDRIGFEAEAPEDLDFHHYQDSMFRLSRSFNLSQDIH